MRVASYDNTRTQPLTLDFGDNFGDIYGAYRNYDTRQFSVKAEAAADIKNHEISFGFEYQKRKYSYFYCAAPYLWGRMRSLTNTHILELDTIVSIFSVMSYNPWPLVK